MAQDWDPGRPLVDMTPGRWLQERLWTWGPGSNRQGLAVGALVPEGFEAYARILHPATSETERGFESVRWSVIASWTGRTVHPLMQFHRIADLPAFPGHRAPKWGFVPSEGEMPSAEGERLVAVLRAHTATPDRCYLGLWEGYGTTYLAASKACVTQVTRDPGLEAYPVPLEGRVDVDGDLINR